ncbi:DNA-binding transcriptional regulator, LysR family [Pseudomonas sp. NFACC02]|uniref:LysR family transcriptional regulator n=1 Tax=Pseudomonas sp. NFACC02 TaxID=1566250 RepID=UPI0008BD318C|nr:LysR family transcriptional regulator [Pseudomonas sp. NFACC02]SER72786.1 DNA-binding transcriptional regulator, LysR family [Pseudomonas sp. NFACC02]
MKDLNLLYTFEALWRDHSTSIAAQNLGVTQSAVSGSLKRLRQSYGDRLFTLVGRRMEPTPFCVQIAGPLLESLNLIRAAERQRVDFDPARCRETFTFRMLDVGEVVCLPPILRQLALHAPLARLNTVGGAMDETLTGLATGRVDLALGYLPSLQTDIHRLPVFSQHYVCAIRREHRLADQELTLSRYLACDHVVVETVGISNQAVERALVDAGGRGCIRMRVPHHLSSAHLVLQSDMVWTLPVALGRTLAQFYPLVIKPVPLHIPSFDIDLYWHDRFHRDPLNKWLREMVSGVLKRQQAEWQ